MNYQPRTGSLPTIPARTAEEINACIHVECEHIVFVNLNDRRIVGACAGAAHLRGTAHGAEFVACDFRGADLRSLDGPLRIVSSLLFGAELPVGAEVIDCEMDRLWSKVQNSKCREELESYVRTATAVC
jgi:hypothetical protein